MTIVATPGASTANSYVTIAAADAFAETDHGPDVDRWRNATAMLKEAALKRATRELDALLRTTAYAAFDPTAQAVSNLYFPRSVDYDDASSPVIHYGIQRATYAQAKYIVSESRAIAAANAHRKRQAGSESEAAPYDGPPIISDEARHYAAPWLPGGIRSVRVSSSYYPPHPGWG